MIAPGVLEFSTNLLRWALAETVVTALLFGAYVILSRLLKHPADRYLFLRLGFFFLLFLPWLRLPWLRCLPGWKSGGPWSSSLTSALGSPAALASGKEDPSEWVVISLAVAYLFGVGALAIRRWRSYRRIRRLISRSERLAGLAIPVSLHDARLPPVTVGWWHPQVLLSRDLYRELTPAELALVLAHEKIHLRRRDSLFNLLRLVVRDLLFFSPFIYPLARRFEEDMELSVDRELLEANQGSVRDYGQLLFQLACRSDADRTPLPAGVFISNHFLRRRLSMMKAKSAWPGIPSRPWQAVCVAMLFLALGLTGLTALGLESGTRSAISSSPGLGDPLQIYIVGEGASGFGSADLLSAKTPSGCRADCPVYVSLKPEATSRFSEFTASKIGKRLAIDYRGKQLANAVIRARIGSGKIELNGNLSGDEAAAVAADLNQAIPH